MLCACPWGCLKDFMACRKTSLLGAGGYYVHLSSDAPDGRYAWKQWFARNSVCLIQTSYNQGPATHHSKLTLRTHVHLQCLLGLGPWVQGPVSYSRPIPVPVVRIHELFDVVSFATLLHVISVCI